MWNRVEVQQSFVRSLFLLSNEYNIYIPVDTHVRLSAECSIKELGRNNLGDLINVRSDLAFYVDSFVPHNMCGTSQIKLYLIFNSYSGYD